MKKLFLFFILSLLFTSCSLFNRGVKDNIVIVRDTVIKYEWRTDTVIVCDTIYSVKDVVTIKLKPKNDSITATNPYDLNNYYLQSGEISVESGTIIHNYEENVSEGLKTSEIKIQQKEKIKEKKQTINNKIYIAIIIALLLFIILGTYCITKNNN